MSEKSLQITVTGLVQGVGFRPFVFRIATKYHLTGWVQNTNENVIIQVSGTQQNINHFLYRLKKEAPAAAMIRDISTIEIDTKTFAAFTIIDSNDISGEITEISPDIAVCSECLQDMDKPGTKHDYAFINCTDCGPRFTIIKDLPYDRSRTTMQTFTMCDNCRREYENIADRRFHAQPVACSGVVLIMNYMREAKLSAIKQILSLMMSAGILRVAASYLSKGSEECICPVMRLMKLQS